MWARVQRHIAGLVLYSCVAPGRYHAALCTLRRASPMRSRWMLPVISSIVLSTY